MPAGARARANSVFGTISDTPVLEPGASSFNSNQLVLLPVISGDHAIITLDPLRQHGDPEIVVVTAHTAASTVATITRGAYGTTARSHPNGTVWAHALVNADTIEILTSSTRPGDPYTGELIYETDNGVYKTWSGIGWDTLSGGPPPRFGWHLRRVANQSIAMGGGVTAITWDTEVQDTPANFAAPGTTLTIPTGGSGLWSITYQMDYEIQLDSNGVMLARVVAGGMTFQTNDSDDVLSGRPPTICLSFIAPLVATDTIVAYTHNLENIAAKNVTGRLLAYRIAQ